MAAEQPGAHDHLLCGCMNAVAASQIFEPPSSPAALAGPSGTDFTNVGVQEMMKLYYCELRCCQGQLLLCRRARRRRRHQLCLLHSSLAHAHLPAAARLFPHQEMYKWLAYGNGELPGCSCPAAACAAAGRALCSRVGCYPVLPLGRAPLSHVRAPRPPWLAGWPRANLSCRRQAPQE